MFKKSFGNLHFNIITQEINIFSDKSVTSFGFIINNKKINFDKENIKNYNGYYLIIDHRTNDVRFYNDFFGNFKVYHTVIENNIYISDDWCFLRDLHAKKLLLNNSSYEFFLDHNYTIGDRTFFDEIKKIPPGVECMYINNEFIIKNRFQNIEKEKFNYKIFKSNIFEELNSFAKSVKFLKNKKTLLFSGGCDSMILANILIENKVDFIAVFFHLKGVNDDDYERALKSSKALAIELEIINIDDNISEINIDNLTKNLTFDKIWDSYIYIKGLIGVKNKFGNDIIIISGQGSDSIFSFGPTEFSLGSFLTRFIIYFPFNFLSKFLCYLNNLKNDKSYRSPNTLIQYYYAFLDEYRYKPLIRPNTLNINIDSVINSTNFNTLDLRNKMFYLKIFGFIQGKDNSGNVWLSKSLGMNNIILPYMTQGILKNIIKYKSNLIDLIFPKYLLRIYLYKKFPSQLFMRYKSDNNISLIVNKFYEQTKNKFDEFIKP